jgi:broad specificity phosphatase PhoE
MKIYLIRHGESTSDVENRYGGIYDDHLTQKGKEQARVLAKELKDKNIEVIFSSPYLRAYETSHELHNLLNCKVIRVDDFRERNLYGILSGMKKSEAAQKYPELVPLLENYQNILPQGEAYSDFVKRIKKGWEKIIHSPYTTVGVVTHAGPIRCIFREILKHGELGQFGDCAMFELADKSGE